MTPADRHEITEACHGFTLLESLLVVALLGVVLSLALPQYQQFLQRGYRVEAIRTLTTAAACQERIRAATGLYDLAQCVDTPSNEHYLLSIEPPANSSVNGYTLIATPIRSSQYDVCGSFSLNHAGTRTISGPAENLWKCWSGR